MPQLFDHVVAASRLGDLVAPYTIRRLLIRANVMPEELNTDHLKSLLPHLEQGLAVFLPPSDLQAAMEDLRRLAHSN